MTAIHHDTHAFERQRLGKRRLGLFHVAPNSVLHADRLADLIGRGPNRFDLAAEDQLLDQILGHIVQLIAVSPEELDAIIIVRIVGGRDHNTGIGPHGSGHIRHTRCRQGSDENDIHAHRKNSGTQRILQHVAGEAGVLANHDPVAHPIPRLRIPILKDMRRRSTQLQGCFSSHRLNVGSTPDTIGSKNPFFVGHISKAETAKSPDNRATRNPAADWGTWILRESPMSLAHAGTIQLIGSSSGALPPRQLVRTFANSCPDPPAKLTYCPCSSRCSATPGFGLTKRRLSRTLWPGGMFSHYSPPVGVNLSVFSYPPWFVPVSRWSYRP